MANDELPMNVTALVIALIALVGTIAQVLQQYYAASAAGYTNCGESVMGKWAESTRRIFRLKELRFEVQFEAPVIFVSPPTNKNGPVKGVAIHYVDGSDESLKATRSLPAKEEEAQRRENKVHTADNERATWVTLLSALHTMEQESWKWRSDHYGVSPAEPECEAISTATPTEEPKPPGATPSPNPQLKDHTLAIAVQVKKRSWDSMPAGVKKPYATTTICHMLEIAAMLGIYWKEFDRSKDRYRAEGNGYILTGTQINDLGLMFTFQVSGGSRFQENRVIPVDEVKELCCGTVSTVFRADKDTRRLGILNEDPRDLGILQLGSMNEIAETMVLIDCNTITASYFRKYDTKHGHLFPVPFELLGMLCKNLHIKGTPYRMLPNPTPYHWDKKFFNLRKLVNEYHKKMKSLVGQKGYTQQAFKQFEQHAAKVVDALAKNKEKDRQRRADEQTRVKEKVQEIKDRRESVAASPQPTTGTATGKETEPSVQPLRWRRSFRIPSLPSLPSKLGRGPTPDEENPAPDAKPKVLPPYHRQGSSLGALGMMGKKSATGYSIELLDVLDEALAECNKFLEMMVKKQPGLVRTVLREHFQEILKMLNGGDDDEDVSPGSHAKAKVRVDEAAGKARKPRKFEELSLASPEDRQKIFMEIYFSDVLNEVKTRAAASFNKMTFYNKKSRPESPFRTPASPNHLTPPVDLAAGDPSDAESDTGAKEDDRMRQTRQQEAAAIWCVFVFRMLCWLTLHDFDKNDVQVPKSELLGSRLPVYIS